MNDNPTTGESTEKYCTCYWDDMGYHIPDPNCREHGNFPKNEPQESAIPGWNVDGTKRNPTTGDTAKKFEEFCAKDPCPSPDKDGKLDPDAYQIWYNRLAAWMESPTNPNPTTGEWTSQTAYDIYRKDDGGFKAIADVHNAALAAAWRKGHADAQQPALERIDKLVQQLAALAKLEEPVQLPMINEDPVITLK